MLPLISPRVCGEGPYTPTNQTNGSHPRLRVTELGYDYPSTVKRVVCSLSNKTNQLEILLDGDSKPE